MNTSWPKVFRDPVHNLIPFEDTPCDRLLLDLQTHDARPEFSFLGDEVVYGQHPLREMRDWEWAARLAAASARLPPPTGRW